MSLLSEVFDPNIGSHKETPRKPLLIHLEGDDYALRIDNSSLEYFTTCARSAEYALLRGRVPKPKAALQYGSAIHKALEMLYTRKTLGSSVTMGEIQVEMEKEFSHDVGPGEWRTPEKALDTITRYANKYRGVDNFTVALDGNGKPMVEIPFSYPIGQIPINATLPYSKDLLLGEGGPEKLYVNTIHVFWTGKIDMVVEMEGDLWVVDHKTSSILGGTYWKDFELSQQTIGYVWACEQMLGRPLKGLLLNVIIGRRPTKTGVSVDFERKRYMYPPHAKEEWIENTMYLVSDAVSYLTRGFFPKMTKWCVGKYGLCPYHDVCTLPPNQRDFLLNSDEYVNNTWSPLDEE